VLERKSPGRARLQDLRKHSDSTWFGKGTTSVVPLQAFKTICASAPAVSFLRRCNFFRNPFSRPVTHRPRSRFGARNSLLQSFHRLLQFPCNLRRIPIPRKPDRPPNPNSNLPRPGKFPSGLLHFKQSHDAHGQHRNIQIIRQQPNPAAKRIHLAVERVPPLGKNQHAVSSIHHLPCVRKTLPEPRFTRQRKQIQQRNSQSPLHTIVYAAKEISIPCRRTQRL